MHINQWFANGTYVSFSSTCTVFFCKLFRVHGTIYKSIHPIFTADLHIGITTNPKGRLKWHVQKPNKSF